MSIQTQAALLGIILCTGLICLVLRFAPARASLPEAMARLTGTGHNTDTSAYVDYDSLPARVGTRLYPYTTGVSWIRIPKSDLAILLITIPRFLGEKILSSLIGFLFLPVLNVLLTLSGHGLSWAMPTIASLALGVFLFFAPDLDVRKKATAAREEFSRSLGAYIEFVALNRTGGVGAVQSLERAAAVGDSWVFRRIDEELQKAQRAGKAPWETLMRVSQELDLPDLADLTDIMTLTGEQGASVAETLSARASSLRNAILSKELGNAGSATEKLQAPLAALALVFMAMLMIPAIGNIMHG